MQPEAVGASTSSLTDVEEAQTMIKLRLQNLMLVTGHPVHKERGLRRFGPAPHAKAAPLGGAEVFAYQLPRDALEDEIYCFFRAAGEIYEIRLLVNASGITNRGFCFVQFFTPEQASRAIAMLNVADFRPNHKIFVRKSKEIRKDNLSLILTGVPRQMTKRDLWLELIRKGFRCKDVVVLKPYKPCFNNRGYVFLEFSCHDDAVAARKLHPNSISLRGSVVKMEWTQSVTKVASEVMAKVTTVFIRNLNPKLKKEMFIETLKGILNYSTISKVYKKFGYGFIHFYTREMAEIGLKQLQEYYTWTDVEIEWSKPPPKQSQHLNSQLQASSRANSHSQCTKYKILQNFVKRLWDNRVEPLAWCFDPQETEENNNLSSWKLLVGDEDCWLGFAQENPDVPQNDKQNYDSRLQNKPSRG